MATKGYAHLDQNDTIPSIELPAPLAALVALGKLRTVEGADSTVVLQAWSTELEDWIDYLTLTGGALPGLNLSSATKLNNQQFGNMATQYSNGVAITGGSISGISPPIPIASGGTSGATASAARIALDLADTEDTLSITNVSNITASTIQDVNTNKHGQSAMCWGRFTIQPTVINTDTRFGISLKYASNLSLFTQAGGGFFSVPTATVPSFTGPLSADITNDRLDGIFKSPGTLATYTLYFYAGYRIKP